MTRALLHARVSTWRRAWLARSVVLAALSLLIMAPTPGAVGACGGDDLDDPADLQSYCQEREQLVCVRKFLRKEITADERDTCRWDAIDTCKRRSFPRDCEPTKRQAQTCINALSSFDTLDIEESKISECNSKALCGIATEETPDGGGFGR